tara:strand:- start:910 stop:1248 length:339 start_codon:yes stop_codon:yes gene_type:complete
MAVCDKCGCFDENEAEYIDYPDYLLDDDDVKQVEWLEEQEDYQPDRYYYWHGDIQEDYQMPRGHECLCDECFGELLNKGEIIEKFDDLTGEPNPNWNPETMGWFMPIEEVAH